ncbi:MAG: PHP domain-containing protein [Armatimonadota bacterium]|nr:PHP domain-containing protein [Armatimonadota bacterium]MDR7400722.1 PHP domain-containing protein [Armatimonadota bacterium]MDR7436467.1 PHP domain-containing protein [Armatimonadota bacterium]MDR7472502.1 PHP domain-containing protein [Armatimonadota bacterium]MDR7506004.1 PHP domain-containing protein [Armatimonadota bacterium]
MRIDLHTHTTASDGLLPPADLVALARQHGVEVLAVADHDTTDGVDPARAAGARLGVEVIPAVEINTDTDAGDVHVLGYFVHHHEAWFQEFLRRLRDGRERRAERMVEKLHALGIPLDFARVRALAGGAVGRPHVARALVEAGVVATTEEAFQKYIGRSGPAYVERVSVSPQEAVRVVRRAGGIPVLAHPGWGVGDDLIRTLAREGLEGLEVYYPDHTPAMVEHYLALAAELGLLVTGGTDFHGGDLATRTPPGSQYVPREAVERLRERARGRLPAGPPPAEAEEAGP